MEPVLTKRMAAVLSEHNIKPLLPKHKAGVDARSAASGVHVLPKHNAVMNEASTKLKPDGRYPSVVSRHWSQLLSRRLSGPHKSD